MDAADWLGIALIIAGAIVSASGVGIIIGVPMIAIGVLVVVLSQFTNALIGIGHLIRRARGNSSASSRPSGEEGVLYSGRDHDTIEAGSYLHYEFDIQQSAVLDYTVDSLQGGEINAILTVPDELDRFEYREDIRILEKGSEFGTEHAAVQTRLDPAGYVLVVDNTGRRRGDPGDTPVDVEVEYEVRA